MRTLYLSFDFQFLTNSTSGDSPYLEIRTLQRYGCEGPNAKQGRAGPGEKYFRFRPESSHFRSESDSILPRKISQIFSGACQGRSFLDHRELRKNREVS